MERRKFVVGLGALASGSAAAMGTGAFTSVEADRTVNVTTADDSDAFLAIEPQDTPNGNDYASSDGTVSLDFTETDSPGNGSGLNQDAETIIRNVLKVTNQGTQDVIVGVTGLPESMSIYTDDGGHAANGSDTSLNQDNNSPSSGNLALVESGDTMEDVGVIFRDPPSTLSGGTITFNAIAVEELKDPQAVRDQYSN